MVEDLVVMVLVKEVVDQKILMVMVDMEVV